MNAFAHRWQGMGLAGLALAVWGLAAPVAAAECPAIPTDVAWWANTSQADIVGYVERHHKGNWDEYVGKWQGQLETLQDIHNRGSAVVVTKDKIRLEGESLRNYIDKVAQRVAAVRCFAEVAKNASGDTTGRDLQAFATAAGSATAATASAPAISSETNIELAGLTSAAPPFRLQITSECSGGEARFRVTNLGERWPQLGTFALFNEATKQPLSERQMRLGERQSFTFKVAAVPGTNYGLRIKPSWYDRGLGTDATLTCR